MKTLRKLMLTLPLVMATLTGCQVKKAGDSVEESVVISESLSEEETTSAEESSVEESLTEESSEESTSSEESSLEESSEEESSEEESSEESVISYTAEGVAGDINAIFSPLIGGSDLLSWYDNYGCFIGALNLGAAEATTDEEHVSELQSAAGFIYSYLPDYLELAAAEYEASYDDYYVGLVAGTDVSVELYAYVNASNLVLVQIQVADLVA